MTATLAKTIKEEVKEIIDYRILREALLTGLVTLNTLMTTSKLPMSRSLSSVRVSWTTLLRSCLI